MNDNNNLNMGADVTPPVQNPQPQYAPPMNFDVNTGNPIPPIVNQPPVNYNQPYQQVPYMQENLQPRNSSDGLAVASMVLGICSIVLSCCFGIGQLLAVIGIILGIVALLGKTQKKGVSIAGIVMSGVTALLAILTIFFVMANPQAVDDFARGFEDGFNRGYNDYYDDYDNYNDYERYEDDEYFLD